MSERRIQTDPTLVLDHEKILSASAKAEIERASQRMLAAEPDDDDAEELQEKAKQEAMNRPTLVPCPVCGGCGFCDGQHLVTPERASEFPPPKDQP